MKRILALVGLVVGSFTLTLGQNLIQNGSFENGAQGWRLPSDVEVKYSGGKDGNNYVEANLYASYYGAFVATEGFETSTAKGETYEMSFWVNKTADESKIQSVIYLFKADGQRAGTERVVLSKEEESGNWKKLKGKVTIDNDEAVSIKEVRIILNGTGAYISIDDVKFYKEGTMSVNDVKGGESVKVYPTLIQDAVNVEVVSKADVTIFNVNGQVVKSVSLNGTTSVLTQELPKGVYIVQVKEGNEVYTQKVVKK